MPVAAWRRPVSPLLPSEMSSAWCSYGFALKQDVALSARKGQRRSSRGANTHSWMKEGTPYFLTKRQPSASVSRERDVPNRRWSCRCTDLSTQDRQDTAWHTPSDASECCKSSRTPWTRWTQVQRDRGWCGHLPVTVWQRKFNLLSRRRCVLQSTGFTHQHERNKWKASQPQTGSISPLENTDLHSNSLHISFKYSLSLNRGRAQGLQGSQQHKKRRESILCSFLFPLKLRERCLA